MGREGREEGRVIMFSALSILSPPRPCRSYDGEEDVAKAFKRRMQQVAATQKQQKTHQPRLLGFK